MSQAALNLAIPSDAPTADQLASFLKAAGDPLRLMILRAMQHNAYSVFELCQLFEIKQSGMSHHLKVMAKAGLVSTRREGNTIFYRRAAVAPLAEMASLHRTVISTADQLPLHDAVESKMAQINALRSEASRRFFEDNAASLEQDQDLIANFSDYSASIGELLDSATRRQGAALEIGPGRGELLAVLSERFDSVYALDNAEQMLSLSRQAASELNNVEFLLGDITDRSLELPPVDCITLNMVLHHIPQPAKVFEVLSQQLLANGVLLVTDLCHHEQSWVKENCGDIWQGFEPQELTRWAEQAGLIQGETLFLALRNGFNIQLSLFKKPEQST